MPFGSTFQRFIDQVCRNFSNDIVVFSNSEKEHKLRVLELFERIDTFGVLNSEKIVFYFLIIWCCFIS